MCFILLLLLVPVFFIGVVGCVKVLTNALPGQDLECLAAALEGGNHVGWQACPWFWYLLGPWPWGCCAAWQAAFCGSDVVATSVVSPAMCGLWRRQA
jgi:hypothetical protein